MTTDLSITDIKTEIYRFTHMHWPSGRGVWFFEVVWSDGARTTKSYSGTYTECKRQLMADVRLDTRHAVRLTVLP